MHPLLKEADNIYRNAKMQKLCQKYHGEDCTRKFLFFLERARERLERAYKSGELGEEEIKKANKLAYLIEKELEEIENEGDID